MNCFEFSNCGRHTKGKSLEECKETAKIKQMAHSTVLFFTQELSRGRLEKLIMSLFSETKNVVLSTGFLKVVRKQINITNLST